MKSELLYSSASLELISWKWVLSMFWKGRKGEKRLLELITVRNYFNCLPECGKPNRQRRKGTGLIRHLKEQMESDQMLQALPNKGCTLPREEEFIICCHSKYNVLLKRTLYPWGQRQTRQFLKQRNNRILRYFHFRAYPHRTLLSKGVTCSWIYT